ncbi:MAG: BACON domain-containing carbohydrate-binding protein [Rikenellaceae bacterium]
MKSAIEAMGQTVGDIPFSEYPGKIRAIQPSVASTLVLSSNESVVEEGDSISIALVSNTTWEYLGFTSTEQSSGTPTFSVSPTSGDGNSTVVVTLTDRDSAEGYFSLNFQTTDGEASAQFIVSVQATTVFVPSISLDSTIESVTASSGSFTIEVTSNTDWTVSESLDWVTVSPTSGSGNDSVVITYTENVATSSRNGLITFTAGTANTTLALSQEAAAVAPTFSFSSESNEVTDGAGSFTLNVISNTDWEITTYNTWLTVSPSSGSGNATVTVSYTANTTSASRSGSIFGYTDDQDAQASHAVSQAAAPYLTLDSTSESVTASSGSLTIDVTSNTDWSVSESLDWVTVSPTSGSGNDSVTVSYQANSNVSGRSGVITFSRGDTDVLFTLTQAAAEATLAIYPATKVISSDSGSFIVDVTSNTDWTVNENLNWATVSPTSGSGNGSVTINYTENSSETTQRVGTITFAAGGKTASLAVTQTVAEPEVVQPTLSISASSSQIQVGGDSITAQITSNTSWYFAGFMTTGSSVGSPSFTVTPSSGEGDTTIEISLASGQDVSGLFQLAFEVNGDTSTYATLLLTVIAEPEVELADGVYPISFNGDWTPTDVFSTYFAFCDADGNETDATASASTSYYRFRDGLNDSELPSQTFRSCSVLTSIVIPDSVTSIAANAIDYCSALTTLSIPDSVTSIGNAAFQNNTSLTELVIPSGVSTLSSSLAFGCSSLTAVTLPEGVTTIGTGAFQNCSSLSSIAIPSTVSAINSYAFYSCSSLVSIDLSDHTMVPTLGTAAIRAIDGLQIFVPMLISPSFRNAANWSTLSSYIVGV